MTDDLPIGVQQVGLSEASLLEAVARPLLRLVQRVTGMETTFVTAINWDEQQQEVLLSLNTGEMQLPEGSTVDWADSMCRSMFLSGKASTSDLGGQVPATPGAMALGMRSFFAVPMLVEDCPIGTVCGASRSAIDLSEVQMESMQLVADALQHVVRAEAMRSKAMLAAELAQIDARDARSEARLQSEHARHMEALAHTDHLTGLPNRRAFMARWEDALARSGRRDHPIGLLFIDVDHFKHINDSHGHPVGDLVLQAVASALKEATTEVSIPGRLGGDEFAMAVTHLDGEALVSIANRVRSLFAEAASRLGVEATLSIGAVSSWDCPRKEMLACADTSLYLGKKGGRDRVWRFNHTTDHSDEALA